MNTFQSINLQPIGFIRSPYNEKFAVPRQPNLISQGNGRLYLLPPYNCAESVRGLSQFSHLWLIFHFHQIKTTSTHNTVRPPRLGGNTRIGVFASRATHRPNPIGLSKVELKAIHISKNEVMLELGSIDLIDKTPILDIKPYLTYSDNEPSAYSGFAQDKPQAQLEVAFCLQTESILSSNSAFAEFGITDPQQFIIDVIAQDPRPAYQQNKKTGKIYGMTLAGYNIRWKIDENNPQKAWVIAIE